MRPVVILPFSSQARLFCQEARQKLLDAGFELRCNESGVRPTADELKEMLSGAFAAVAGSERYSADVLRSAKGLKVLIRFGVGTDNLDLDTMREMGIKAGVITNFNSVAEYALTLTLALIKNLPRHCAAADAGQWNRYPMRELGGKTIGIIGFGRIGRRYAQLVRGFGTTLLVYDPYVSAEAVRAEGAEPVDLETLLRGSDIISLHLPYTPQVRHIIGPDRIALMKDGAFLVNTARGGLVDEKALCEALASGKLAGAALDVFETEPIASDDPLLTADNVILSPHASAQSLEVNYNGSIIAAESIIRVSRGGEPLYPVR